MTKGNKSNPPGCEVASFSFTFIWTLTNLEVSLAPPGGLESRANVSKIFH